jgi:hypothetical protein
MSSQIHDGDSRECGNCRDLEIQVEAHEEEIAAQKRRISLMIYTHEELLTSLSALDRYNRELDDELAKARQETNSLRSIPLGDLAEKLNQLADAKIKEIIEMLNRELKSRESRSPEKKDECQICKDCRETRPSNEIWKCQCPSRICEDCVDQIVDGDEHRCPFCRKENKKRRRIRFNLEQC